MKTKLLFTAALMAATVGMQAIPNTGSSMLVQLLESQRLENNVAVLAEGDKERPAEDNTDVTDWIVNPDFSEGITGWTGLAEEEIQEGLVQKYCRTESWGYWVFSQDIAGLPSGEYQLSAQCAMATSDRLYLFMRSSYEQREAQLKWTVYGGNTAQEVATAWSNDAESGKFSLAGNVLVLDGQVTIGVERRGNGYNGNTFFDNFKLTYVNNGSARVNSIYHAKVGELRDATTYPAGLQARVTTAKADKEITTDNFLTEYAALEAEVAILNSSAVSDFMSLVERYSRVSGLSEETQAAITAAITKANEDLAKAESAEAVAQINADLTTAFEQATEGQDYVVAEFDFNDGSTDGWAGAVDKMAEAGVMEFYNQDFDFWYELTNLQAGWYQVEVNAYYRSGGIDASYNAYQNGTDKNVAVIFGDNGNDSERYSVPAFNLYDVECGDLGTMSDHGNYPQWRSEANTCFSAGRYKTTVNVYVDKDGILHFGLANTNHQNDSWMCFDNFKVTYKGDDLSAMYAAMQVQAVALAEKYGMTAYAEGLNSLSKPETVDEATIWDLNERTKAIIDIVNGMVDFPANLEAYKSSIEEALANSEASEEDKGFYTDLQNLSLANVTSLEDMDVEGAYHNYLRVANPTDGYQFDMTWLLTNPDVTGMPVWQNLPSVGWSTDINGGNQQTNNSTNSKGVSEFIEVWTNTTPQIGWILYQNIVVPEGQYKLTADAFASAPSNVCLYAGENKGDAIPQEATSFAAKANLEISFASAGEAMRLGLKGETDNASAWCGFNNLKLYKVAATDLPLDEASETYDVATDTYANVTLTRSLKADAWNTFCVPFDMTPEQLAENGITDVRALESASVEGESVTLNFSESNLNAVEAGVPYLVKVDASYDGTINVENVLVSAAEPTTVSVDGGVSMTGNYAAGTVPIGAYFISNNAFYYADEASNVALKGFRAYIQLNNDVQNANRLMINLDGEVTGIEDVLGEEAAEADKLVNVVSLDGMTVKAGVKKSEALDGLQKGIYIVDGKKYVVK